MRQFVDSKAMRLSRDMSPATSRFESPQPEPQIKKAVTVQPVEPEVRKDIPVKHTERIRKFAEENIAAEIAGDYSRMVDLRYPNIVELSGGREKVMNLLRQERKDLLAKGIAIAGAEASEPTQVATGRDKEFAIVPVTLRLKGPKGTPLIHAKSFTSRFRQTVATHGRSLKALI